MFMCFIISASVDGLKWSAIPFVMLSIKLVSFIDITAVHLIALFREQNRLKRQTCLSC